MGGAVSAVGDAIGDVAGYVGRAVENVIENPLPVIETLALTAVGVPAPVASGIVNYANGGNIQSAIAAGAGSYLGTEATKFAGDLGVPAPIATGIGRAAGGTVSALGAGKSASEALKSGAISGIAGTAGEYAAQESGLDPESLGAAVVRAGTSGVLSNVLGGKSTQPSTQPAVTGQPTANAPAAGAAITPGSAALAQALKTDMGEPIFGGEKEGAARKWGDGESTGSSALREMGSGIV